MRQKLELTGQTFGRLKVLKFDSIKRTGLYWDCCCKCGNKKTIRVDHLTSGETVSCGCYRAELSSERRKKTIKHGDAREGKSKRLYRIWKIMKGRCNNPLNSGYKYYGGKGITICKQWEDYIPFRQWALSNGYQDDLTIDRKNGNAGYFPDNCRWATRKEQTRNSTQTKLDVVKVKTIKQMLKKHNLSYRAIGEMFGVKGTAISNIDHGKTWTDIRCVN